jgi:hypothetical protein
MSEHRLPPRPARSYICAMADGRINSPDSIRTASEVVRAFGGWQAVEAAAHRGQDGIYKISRRDMERQRQRRAGTDD